MQLRILLAATLVTLTPGLVAADPHVKPPRAVVSKPLTLEQVDGAVLVRIDHGSNDGITKASSCAFLDASDQIVSTACAVIRINKTAATCKAPEPLETVKAYAGIRVTTPAAQ